MTIIHNSRHIVIPGLPGLRVHTPRGGAAAANLVTNGSFSSNTSGWTEYLATLSSVAGGESGNCLQEVNTGGVYGYAYQAVTVVSGTLCTLNYWHLTGGPVPRNGKVVVGSTIGGTEYYDSGEISDPSWNERTTTFTPSVTTIYIVCYIISTSAGRSTLFDEIVLTQ